MTDQFNFNPRKWHRSAVELPAQYFIKGQSARYLDCTIINLSRSGATVQFPPNELLKARASIFFELLVPKTCEQLTVKGELKTKHKSQDGHICGIQFEALLPEDMFAKLT
jgi:hypothetical protein